ncbi:MAG: carboxypeptidase-like regulatory domain-containing protein [Cyclobacteriaceae bacterium]
MKKLIHILLISMATLPAFAQEITSSIRGQIVDTQSDFPLTRGNVILLGSDPLIGSATDAEGYYRLNNVPAGQHTLRISFMGYNEQTVPNVMVTSGKEAVLNIKLEEKILMGEEIVITATPEKTATNNELTTVSSRFFNLEETGRYAGSRNDPARMAANFAGVAANNNDRSDILIRGNSPGGLL